jgi:uracil-DNA glycosylase
VSDTDTAPHPNAPDLAGVVPVAWRPYVDLPALRHVETFLGGEVEAGRRIQPLRAQVFKALDMVAPQDVKVVLCGQDPYPGLGVPMGMAFSVPPDAPVPGSLKTLYAELQDDLGIPPAPTGDLTPWAAHGMLLLNASLTVRPGEPGSHNGAKWPAVTLELLRRLAAEREGIVFLALGRAAQNVIVKLPTDGHRVVEAAHPSPMSVAAFRGSRIFSRTDAALAELGRPAFDWRLG